MVLLGLVLIPRKWWGWLMIVGVYGWFVWWVNRFEPIPRYDISHYIIIRVLVFGTLALMVGAILWQLYRTLRWRTLRSRLLVTFMAVVIVPILLVNGVSGTRGFRMGQQRLFENLNALSVLKKEALDTWLARLRLSFNVERRRTNALSLALLEADSGSAEFQAAHEALLRRFQQTIKLRHDFETFFLMDLKGHVILSTDRAQEGNIYDQAPYFQNALEDLYVYSSLASPPLNEMVIILSRPVVGSQGQSIGVLAARADVSKLGEILGFQSEMAAEPALAVDFHLVAPIALDSVSGVEQETSYLVIASSRSGQGEEYRLSSEIDVAMRDYEGGSEGRWSGISENYRGVSVIGVYRWLPGLNMALLTERETALAFRESRVSLWINLSLAVGTLLIAGVVALITTQNITRPLTTLAADATRIASGDLQHTTSVEREDEIGILARAFNTMTAQLRGLISDLEQRVTERTRDLEHRSRYLAAAAEVGMVVGTSLDPQQLMREIVGSMRKAFGFQYVGLFTLDEALKGEEQRVVLQAGAGEIPEYQGMDEPAIIEEAVLDQEAQVLQNDAMEGGASQIALPLRARNEVLGVLSIYTLDKELHPFDKDMINVLQMMADEIAVALENARLFEQNQKALDTARRAYGEFVGDAWAERFRERREWGYRYVTSFEKGEQPLRWGLDDDVESVVPVEGQEDAAASQVPVTSPMPGSVVPVEGDWRPEMLQAARQGEPVKRETDSKDPTELALPIKSHGQVIGVLHLHAEDAPISPDQVSILEEVTNRLGLALENARLLDDSRQRAAREQLTASLAARMREPLDVDSVLRTAARELYEGLGLSKVRVRLTSSRSDFRESVHDVSLVDTRGNKEEI
jgi:GAF domain-containing protein/HAMP domain-containing protein